MKTKYFQDGSDPGIDVSDDEELREVLDMHQLVYQQGPPSDSPPQTAEQVIEEIDQMLQVCFNCKVCFINATIVLHWALILNLMFRKED